MITGAQLVELQSQRLLSAEDLKDRVLAYYMNGAKQLGKRVFSVGSVFGALTLISAGADKFTIVGSSMACDGEGIFFDPALCKSTSPLVDFMVAINFENTNGAIYKIGFHYTQIPGGVMLNPRTGKPEILSMADQIGESAAPDLVTDLVGTLRFRVDTATRGAHKSSGRWCYVWKRAPATSSPQYLALGQISWDGSHNYIDVAHYFGQSVASTTAADYQVVVVGPSIGYPTNPLPAMGYCILGSVIGTGSGNPPVTFDTTEQVAVDFSLSDLNLEIDNYAVLDATPGTGTGGRSVTTYPGSARCEMATFTFNDQVYILGGRRDSLVCDADVASYNPSFDSWTIKASIPVTTVPGARSGIRAVLVGSLAYVMGGGDNVVNQAVNVTQIYNPNSNTWSLGANMPGQRYLGMAAAVDTNRIYYIGGQNIAGTPQSTTYQYTISNNTWTTKSALPATFYASGCASLGGKIYIFGGYKSGVATNEIWRYDPDADTWTLMTATIGTLAAVHLHAATRGNMIFIVGGNTSIGPSASWSVYIPRIDTRISLQEIPSAGFFAHALGTWSNGIRVIGGNYQGNQAIGTYTAWFEHFAVDLSGFHLAEGPGTMTSMQQARAATISSQQTLESPYPNGIQTHLPVVRVGRSVYAIGGTANGVDGHKLCWRWNVDTRTWTRLADLNTARGLHGVVYHPGEHAIYACGGKTSAVISALGVERYDIATDSWTTVNATLDRLAFGSAHLVGNKIYMIGGGAVNGNDTPLTSGSIYDIRTGIVSPTTNLPAQRRWTLSFAVMRQSRADSVDFVYAFGVGLPKPSGPVSIENTGTAHIYIMGGDAGGNVLNTIYVYDTATDAVTTHASVLPAARGYSLMAPIQGRPTLALVCGSVSPTTSANTTVAIYDFGTMTLTSIGTTLPSARMTCGAVEIDGIVYAFGGASGTTAAKVGQNTAYGFRTNLMFRYVPTPVLGLSNFTADSDSGAVGMTPSAPSIAFATNHLYGWYSWSRGVAQQTVRLGDRP